MTIEEIEKDGRERRGGEHVERRQISDRSNTPAFQKRQHSLLRQSWLYSNNMNMLMGISLCRCSSCVDVKYTMLCETISANRETVSDLGE